MATVQLTQLCSQVTPPTLLAVALVAAAVLLMALSRRSTVPGPLVTWPLVGETVELLRRGPCAFFMGRYKRFGGIYRTNMLGLNNVYCVLDPTLVRTFMRMDGIAFTLPPALSTLIGDVGHMVDGPDHDYFRKVFGTCTSPAAIDRMLPVIVDTISGLLAQHEAAGRQRLYDAAGDIIYELAMQVVVCVDLKRTDPVWFKQELLTYIAGVNALPIELPGFAYHRSCQARNNVLNALAQEVEQSVSQLVQEDPASGAEAVVKRHPSEPLRLAMARATEAAAEPPEVAQERRESERVKVNAMATESMRRLAAMDKAGGGLSSDAAESPDKPAAGVVALQLDAQLEMLRSTKLLSPAYAAERLLGSLFAAMDTSRKAVMVAFELLAELPDEVEKLLAEQKQLIKKHGESITPAVLAEALYLDAFCKEAARLIPSASLVLRAALCDVHLGGHAIPKGAYLVAVSDMMHALDPVLWTGDMDPAKAVPPHMDYQNNLRGAFQPGRWLSESTRPKHMFTFSSGGHTCLGRHLIYTELKVLVALLVRGRYHIAFDKPRVLQHTKHFPTVQLPKGNEHVRIWRPAAAPSV